ncbi:MAG: hypothetical protein ABUT20_26125 [Bacteroidota bacterium]
MPTETEDKLNVSLKNLADETEKYNQAAMAGAGFNERREIRTQIREIESEIQRLRNILKS